MGGMDFASVVFIFILGLNCFTSAFKFMQANSVSRKRFFAGTIIALGVVALAMATLDSILSIALRNIIPYSSMLEQLYGTRSVFASLLYSTTLAAFAAHTGWMISMLYYRSNKLQKIAISLSPLFVIITLVFLNRRTAGRVGTAIIRFLGSVLGFYNGPSPYIASLSFIVGTALISAICYLLIRNAPVKD